MDYFEDLAECLERDAFEAWWNSSDEYLNDDEQEAFLTSGMEAEGFKDILW